MPLSPLHRATIRLAAASGPGVVQQDLLMLVQARTKAKTPGAAKKLFDSHKYKHPGTKLSPKDFLDREKGTEESVAEYPSERRRDREKKQKGRSKEDIGEEKTKRRTEESAGKNRARQRGYGRNYGPDPVEWTTTGREKAQKKLKGLSPAKHKAEVDKILRDMGGGVDEPMDLDKALRSLNYDMTSKQQKHEYAQRSDFQNKMKTLGYRQTILSKYKKNQGSKAEKGKAKTKVNDAAAKAGLEEADVKAIKSFAKGRKKKLDTKAIAKLKDKEWVAYWDYRWTDLSKPERKRYVDLKYGPGGGQAPKTVAQLQAEAKKDFLANADPETKKRVQKMSPAEFEAMIAAIMDDEEVSGSGKKGALRTAAIHLAASLPEGDSVRAAVLELLAG